MISRRLSASRDSGVELGLCARQYGANTLVKYSEHGLCRSTRVMPSSESPTRGGCPGSTTAPVPAYRSPAKNTFIKEMRKLSAIAAENSASVVSTVVAAASTSESPMPIGSEVRYALAILAYSLL